MNVLFFILSIFLLNDSFAIQKFDSAHAVLLEGDIVEGVIYSNSSDPLILNDEIISQLKYSIGQLNGEEGGCPDMSKTTIDHKNISSENENHFKVTYNAHLNIAWPSDKAVPEKYLLYLPREGGWNFLYGLMQKYGPEGDSDYNCIDYSAHEVGPGNFWYYYRPLKSVCPLSKNSNEVVIIPLILNISDLNSTDKYPEYDKVWEDKKLIATLVFGMNTPEIFNQFDAGVEAFTSMIKLSLKNCGTLTWSNIPQIDQYYLPKDTERIVHLKFNNEVGEVDLVLILVDSIRNVIEGSEIQKIYRVRSEISDFISYNGHSGLGANIRKLSSMGSFVQNQYQIFMVNGCDTFAYIDDSLARAHQLVNPDYLPSKFFDIITNSMQSYFHRNAESNITLLSALLEKKKTYKKS